MMFNFFTRASIALLCASVANGFVAGPSVRTQSSPTALQMKMNEGVMKKAAVSLVAAAFVLGNAATAQPASAMDDGYFGSSQVIAARSGGRAGGRASSARSSYSPSRSATTNTRTVINRTTYVTPSPVYSSPSVIVAPPVYNPMPGLGLSLGLNAVSNIGNDMRDYRQEREIQDTRSELERSRMREVEMEARLRQLEQGQGQLSIQQQTQMQQQMLLQQQQAAAATK